jgi:hypothetical protein
MKLVRRIAVIALVLTVAMAAVEGFSPRGLPSVSVTSWMEAGHQIESAIVKVSQFAIRKAVERVITALPISATRSYRLGTLQMTCLNGKGPPGESAVLIVPFHEVGRAIPTAVFPPTHDFAAPPTPVREGVVVLSPDYI